METELHGLTIQKHSGLLCFFCVALLFASVQMALAGELAVQTTVRSGPLRIQVHFRETKEQWAEYIGSQTALYLPLAERYLGRRVPARRRIDIYGCDNCQSYYDNNRIFLNYEISEIGNPSLLFHELGHLWFGGLWDYSGEEWMHEGIVSFLPIALRHAGSLPADDAYYTAVLRHWGMWWTGTETVQDLPLSRYTQLDKALFYTKTFRLQHLIYHQLGPQKYRQLLRTMLQQEPKTSKAVVSLLTKAKRANWRSRLAGWVFSGAYTWMALNDFLLDADSDGLSDAQERALGTNPNNHDTDSDLLPDGSELLLRTDPRRATTGALERLLQHGPFIDGNSADWEYFAAAVKSEEVGDSPPGSWSDFSSLTYYVKNGVLYLRVDTVTRPTAVENIFFDVLVDTDGDYYTDVEFAFFTRNPQLTWKYNSAAQESTQPRDLRGALGAVFEIAIPLREIGVSSFRILPILRDDDAKINLDGWEEWIEIQAE